MAKKYSTAFALTEDPLSESSVWAAPSNVTLTRMRSASGRAIAKAAGVGAYDDSAAHLTGYGADYEMTSTVYKDGSLNRSATHECEHLLRINDTVSVTAQYEALYSYSGSTQCVRWFSNLGTQDFDFLTALAGGTSLGGEFSTGDKIRTRVSGSFITMSAIVGSTETFLALYSNTVLASGQPGIGGFTRVLDGGDASKFAFDDAQISDIFIDQVLATDDFNRANESPLSGGGNWSTPTDMAALRLVSNEVANVTAGTDSGARYVGVAAGIDHWSEITIGSTVGDSDFGATVCHQANGDCYLTTGYDGVKIYVFTRIAGAFNEILNVTATYTAGDVIRLERFGSLLRLYRNGSLIGSVDNVLLFQGTFGIFGFDGNYRITSWRGGKLVADYDAVPGSGGTVSTQTLTDALIAADGFISSAMRGHTGADTLTAADFTISGALRQVIATDPVAFSEELRYFLIRNRLLEDGYVMADGFISVATVSQIITLITTSLAAFTDESFLFLLRSLSATDLFSLADSSLGSLERNLLGTDTFVTTDQGQGTLAFNRFSESSSGISDAQFNFKLLTRRIESALALADSGVADFIDGEGALVDGSAIRLGFTRMPVAIGREERKILLGRDGLVRIH